MSCDTLPGDLNLTIYQGATFNPVLTWLTGTPSTPVDLTGFTADMKVKDGTTTLVALTSTSGITLGGVLGTIAILVSATDTAALTPGNYGYDLLLTSSGGIVYPLVAGLMTVRKGFTV